MNLKTKAALAGVSGLLCYVVFHLGVDSTWPEPLFWILSGTIFAAGVLSPYLKYDRSTWYRGFALIVTSALSYWAALETFDQIVTMAIETSAFLAASLVGAFIVLIGARLIIPLNRSISLFFVGFPVAIIGGLAFPLALELNFHSSSISEEFSISLAFMAWHSLMAVAIHVAENWQLRIGKLE